MPPLLPVLLFALCAPSCNPFTRSSSSSSSSEHYSAGLQPCGDATRLQDVFKEFQTILNTYYGYEIEVEIKPGDNNNSPLNHKNKIESDRQSKAEKDVLSDPSIQKFLDKYDGNIKDGSIKPVN